MFNKLEVCILELMTEALKKLITFLYLDIQ